MRKSLKKENWMERFSGVYWEVNRSAVSIAGQVTDVDTDKAVGGVNVMATSGLKRFSTLTGIDGHFHFVDLPDGKYSLTVKPPLISKRYGAIQMEADAYHNVEGNMKKLSGGEHKTKISIDEPGSSEAGDLVIKLKS